MTLTEIIKLGERATQGEWYEVFETGFEDGRMIVGKGGYDDIVASSNVKNARYIAACSPARLLPILKAALEMRDILVQVTEETLGYERHDMAKALAAFDRAARGEP